MTSSALASKNRSNKNRKAKNQNNFGSIKWSVELPETKASIDQNLEEKCSKENISIEQIIYFSLTSLKAKIFYSVVLELLDTLSNTTFS